MQFLNKPFQFILCCYWHVRSYFHINFFYLAIRQNNKEKIAHYLKNHSKVIFHPYLFSTSFNPFQFACHAASKEILDMIFECPDIFNVNYLNRKSRIIEGRKYDETVLHYLCDYQRIEPIKKILCIDGLDINAQDQKGNTPLIKLCYSYRESNNYKIIVQDLIKAGVDCFLRNNEKISALGYCCMRDRANIAYLIVSQWNQKYGVEHFEECLKFGHAQILEMFLNRDWDYFKDSLMEFDAKSSQQPENVLVLQIKVRLEDSLSFRIGNKKINKL